MLDQAQAPPSDPMLEGILQRMIDAGEPEENMAAVVREYTRPKEKHTPTLQEAAGAFWDQHPTLKGLAKGATSTLPFAGAVGASVLAPEAPILAPAGGAAIGRGLEDQINEVAGLTPPTDGVLKTKNILAEGVGTGAGGVLLSGLMNPEATVKAIAPGIGRVAGAVEETIGPWLNRKLPVLRLAGPVRGWAQHQSGSKTPVVSPPLRDDAVTGLPNEVIPAAGATEVARGASTSAPKLSVTVPEDATASVEGIPGITPEQVAYIKGLPQEAQATVLAQLRGASSRPVVAASAVAPKVSRFNATAAPETLVNNPTASPSGLRIAPPKIAVKDLPPSTSKAARDIGEVLSPNDLDTLNEKYGVRLPMGTKLAALREDIAQDLLKSRASRHQTYRANATSDAKYRQETGDVVPAPATPAIAPPDSSLDALAATLTKLNPSMSREEAIARARFFLGRSDVP